MKKLAITILALGMVAGTVTAQKLKGSDTALPIAQQAAALFMKNNSKASVTVTGGGSGVGISALMDGTTDIAMASRKMKFDEKTKMRDAGKSPVEVVIAYDALAVIVNPANKVGQLTREQIESIFTGKVKNWKELGGDDLAIVVYSRESSSGTYEFFKESVMKNKNYMSSILSMPATGAIVQSVSQTKGAIGYIGLAYVNKNIKPVKVSYNGGKSYIEPTFANAKNKTYPVVRPLFFYYDKAKEKSVKAFIDFVLSDEGQKIVDKVGYIDIKK